MQEFLLGLAAMERPASTCDATVTEIVLRHRIQLIFTVFANEQRIGLPQAKQLIHAVLRRELGPHSVPDTDIVVTHSMRILGGDPDGAIDYDCFEKLVLGGAMPAAFVCACDQQLLRRVARGRWFDAVWGGVSD